MNNYEAMLILKPDLPEEERKTLFNQINEAVSKNQGKVTLASVWAEKRKFTFPIKRYQEGLYYLMGFSIASQAVKEVSQAYKLNENILRVLITRVE
jgi:small subunit ribosomal protein S6